MRCPDCEQTMIQDDNGYYDCLNDQCLVLSVKVYRERSIPLPKVRRLNN